MVVGGILIGFGTGLLLGQNLLFDEGGLLAASISSLILGGVLFTLGLSVKTRKWEKKEDVVKISAPPVPPSPPSAPAI